MLPTWPDPTTPERSLRSRLRADTRAAHERLDASFAGLAEGDPAGYGLFLRMNEACHRTIEPLLAASPLAEARLGAGSLHAAALADVEAMGLRRIAPLSFPITAPTLAEALGIAYVVEGSKLGAKQILRRLEKGMHAATDRLPTAFLTRAAASAEGFKDFLALAERLAATHFERDAAVRAADATFGYFLEVVRRAGTPNTNGGEAN